MGAFLTETFVVPAGYFFFKISGFGVNLMDRLRRKA
jgi:hypothetical protein